MGNGRVTRADKIDCLGKAMTIKVRSRDFKVSERYMLREACFQSSLAYMIYWEAQYVQIIIINHSLLCS